MTELLNRHLELCFNPLSEDPLQKKQDEGLAVWADGITALMYLAIFLM